MKKRAFIPSQRLRLSFSGLLLSGLFLQGSTASDLKEGTAQPLPTRLGLNDADTRFTEADIFVNAHPDLRYRRQGQEALRRKNLRKAHEAFLKAAEFGDKVSQMVLAEFHWEGIGTPEDRVLGYVWADLAAERGTLSMVAKREFFWQSLSEDQRARVAAIGEDFYARYGDDVAHPRWEKSIRSALRGSAGSPIGARWTREGIVCLDGQCTFTVDNGDFYDAKYWASEKYWNWQEKIMNVSFNPHMLLTPNVDVGDPEAAPSSNRSRKSLSMRTKVDQEASSTAD